MFGAVFVNLLRFLFFPFSWLLRKRLIRRGLHLEVTIRGDIQEVSLPVAFAPWFRRPPSHLHYLIQHADAIAQEAKIAAVVVTVRSMSAGLGSVLSLRDALLRIRQSGKRIVLYMPMGIDNRSALLVLCADKLYVGPQTTIAITGFATFRRMMRQALAHVGITAEVFAKGKFKSAGEGFIRDSMSDTDKFQTTQLLESQYSALIQSLSSGRNVNIEAAKQWVDDAPMSAQDASQRNIIDGILYEDEFEKTMYVSHEKHVPRATLAQYRAAIARTQFSRVLPRPMIGIVRIHGPIVSHSPFSLAPIADEETIVSAIRVAHMSKRIRGVVLYIESPGGSALASDRIYHEVQRLAAVKPVVAYFSNVAASGGYYIASAAHKIVAQPLVLTGSIGVVAVRPVLGALLEKVGVTIETLKRGEHADFLSPFRESTEQERIIMDRELSHFYERFLSIVAQGRKKTVDEIRPLAEGRVYSGSEALSCGLVDRLGGFVDAVEEVRQRVGDMDRKMVPTWIRAPKHVPPPTDTEERVAKMVSSIAPSFIDVAKILVSTSVNDRVLAFSLESCALQQVV